MANVKQTHPMSGHHGGARVDVSYRVFGSAVRRKIARLEKKVPAMRCTFVFIVLACSLSKTTGQAPKEGRITRLIDNEQKGGQNALWGGTVAWSTGGGNHDQPKPGGDRLSLIAELEVQYAQPKPFYKLQEVEVPYPSSIDMYRRSRSHVGDTSRIRRVIGKAKAGGTVSILIVGGSNAHGQQCGFAPTPEKMSGSSQHDCCFAGKFIAWAARKPVSTG
jgi:hypothetical protein